MASDYLKNPASNSSGTDYTRLPPESRSEKVEEEQETLSDWVKYVKEAEEHRKDFLTQIKINRKFAAGKQHMNVNTRDGRVVDVRERNGIKLVTADILTQFINTAVGRMSANDVRPNFIAATDDEYASQVTEQMNLAFGWGWDNEWEGDAKIMQLWRLLVIDGTAAIRVRYDKNFGEIVGEMPVRDDKPVYDPEEARAYMGDEHAAGRRPKLKTVREGKVVWEILTAENLLPPPGYDDPRDFPREAVVRPVQLVDLKARYGDKAEGLIEEEIDSSASLTSGLGYGDGQDVKLKGRVMVYTGYRRPCADYPQGQVIVFTKNRILDNRKHLPFDSHPRGASTGLHYFRWQVIPGRFMGRAFIEGGIGPQQVRNKRLTQMDAIIDRNMPFILIEEQSLARRSSGAPMEYVEIRPGAPIPKVEAGVPPGAWMLQDVKLQEENAEKALGLSQTVMGQPPQGVSAYSAMALLTENNVTKLDAIAQDFNLEMKETSWDTMEAMRNWPSNKSLLIAGPEDQLRSLLFAGNKVPDRYLARIPRGGSLPRSQAAELQKINDIWQASAGKLPLEWYITSLNAGKAQDLPPSIGDVQLHKAELENIVMMQFGEPLPVADSDDHMKHAESHRAFQVPLRTMADMGDSESARQADIMEMHLQEHLTKAQGGMEGSGSMMPATAGPSLPPQNLPQGGGLPDAPQAPSLPSLPFPGLG